MPQGVRGIRGCGAGRPKGATNKLTADIKAMILAAFDKAGGVDYLVRQSELNPVAFMALLGKVLPLQVTGANDGPIMIITGVPRISDDLSPANGYDATPEYGNVRPGLAALPAPPALPAQPIDGDRLMRQAALASGPPFRARPATCPPRSLTAGWA